VLFGGSTFVRDAVRAGEEHRPDEVAPEIQAGDGSGLGAPTGFDFRKVIPSVPFD